MSNYSFKSKYCEIFINKVKSIFHSAKIEVVQRNHLLIINAIVPDETYGENLEISLVDHYNETTIGHEFKDHTHYCYDDDGEEFVDKTIEYALKIYKSK